MPRVIRGLVVGCALALGLVALGCCCLDKDKPPPESPPLPLGTPGPAQPGLTPARTNGS